MSQFKTKILVRKYFLHYKICPKIIPLKLAKSGDMFFVTDLEHFSPAPQNASTLCVCFPHWLLQHTMRRSIQVT